MADEADKGKQLPRIRTYASDLSEEMRERGATMSSIVMAERERPVPAGTEPASRRHTLIFAGAALFLIVLGLASVTAAVVFRKPSTTVPAANSIIFANRSITIPAGGTVGNVLAGERASAALSLGEIENIALLGVGDVPLAGADFARAMGIPDAVARDVTDAMVGIHAFERNQPFIILRVAAYDRVFGAMLKWEPDMARDLGAFFAPPGVTVAPDQQFKDAIFQNIDVRVRDGTWPILYAFPSQNLLIITTNEFTVREILSRLANAR